jgi:hypothetical protein
VGGASTTKLTCNEKVSPGAGAVTKIAAPALEKIDSVINGFLSELNPTSYHCFLQKCCVNIFMEDTSRKVLQTIDIS